MALSASSLSGPVRIAPVGAVLALGAVLAACDAGRSPAVDFPDDAQIVSALRADFTEDPNNERARTLIVQLGGEKGTLDYAIRRVVSRQGAFEAHYDVTLRMAQGGDASLSQLYAQMIPAEEAARLPQPVTLPEQEKWLRQQAETLKKSSPEEAAALLGTLDTLGPCYRDAKAGDSVTLMTGLAALLSPTRDGWYAERLQSPRAALTCLPA